MGLFLNTAIAQNCTESDVNSALQHLAQKDPSLAPAACQYKQCGQGVQILLPERRTDYDKLAKALSEEMSSPVLLLYIHDEHYWGYFFYDSGRELDCFHPIPGGLEKTPPEKRQRLAGNSGVIAQHFHIDQGTIRHYLVEWPQELLDDAQPSTAYPDDQFCVGNPWQMTDFMKKLGFPYLWGENAPSQAVSKPQTVAEPPLKQIVPPLETASDEPPSETVPISPAPPETAPLPQNISPANAGHCRRLPVLMTAIVAAIAAGAGCACWSFVAYTSKQYEVLPISIGIVLASIVLNVILWKRYIGLKKQIKSNLVEMLK